jgi:gamma-glutamyltranspeptidase/glutathione hydrolase
VAFRPTLLARDWLVTSEHYLSAQAAAGILAGGGTAMDGAVAAILVEGLVNPHMHTLGGEVVMLVHEARTGAVHVVNGNTCAPRGLTLERCRELGPTGIPGDHPLAWGVPAAPHALLTALARWGTRRFAEVAAPALDLARRGFPMHPGLRGPGEFLSIAAHAETFRTKWPSSAALYLPGGRLPAVGERATNPDLAAVLDTLCDAERRAGGDRAAGLAAAREAFYRGDPAATIAAFAGERGGVLARADLEAYATTIEAPIHRDFAGLTVYKCPPWSTGGVFLQTLGLLDPSALRAAGHDSADYLHTLVEALKLAFADRERYYGDPRHVAVPMAALLSDAYAACRRPLIDPAHASLDERPGDPRGPHAHAAGPPPRSATWGPGTVHVNVVDRERNMVSATSSGAWIGGAPIVPGLGVPLTTRLQFFSLEPGHPNVVAPGKQPRTTLTPGLVLAGGRPHLILGTMGGDHQDQWSLQVFLNLAVFGMEVQEAIEAPRLSTQHPVNSFYPHEARRGAVRIEARVPYAVRRELLARGHRLELRPDWTEGYVVAIRVDDADGWMAGGADPRGEVATVMPAYAIGW